MISSASIIGRRKCRRDMNDYASFQRRSQIVQSWSSVVRVTGLLVLIVACRTLAAQPQSLNTSTDLEQAQALIQLGRLEDAKASVLAYLRNIPSSVEGYNLLGIIESDRQDYPDAIAAFQKALQFSPNSAKVRINLGNVYLAEKRLDLAEKEFRSVLRLYPGNRDGNYNLGLLLMAKGSPAEAIPHLERVRPPNVETTLNLVRAYLQSKRVAEALRLATEISAQNKSDVKVHFSLGVLLAADNQWKPAQLEFERADALQSGTFEILYNLGRTYLLNDENSKAELVLNQALKLEPESPETLYLLAQICSKDSRPLDALDLLVRAHKLAPENTDIIYRMAQISISQNYYEDAIPVLESGLKIAPRRSDIRAALGQSYFMAGKVDQAIEQFKKLVETAPSASSYAFLGISYRNLGRFDEATQYLLQGLKLDPHNNSCLFNLGLIAARQGDAPGAEARFQEVLRSQPDLPDALLELANLRIAARKLSEAQELLKKYVRLSPNPATGYYKLAMVERSLHETAASDRDLNVFKTLSKNAAPAPHYYEHLFDYLDTRSKLAPEARDQLDMTDLTDQIKKHPDQPEALYLLAAAYLKSGKVEDAKNTIAQLDKASSGDFRTLTGVGVLLARYRLYEDAIQHFQAALEANPDSDEEKFDLANAYFRKGLYSKALDTAGQVSEDGRKDDAYLALLGDIYAHLGDTARAEEIFRNAIGRNPDNDQGYLSLALIEFRENNIRDAKQTLLKGQARIPASGKILWGLGIASALEGNTREAAEQFERAVDLLPEWPGSYSTLGVFYFETGQLEKAKEVLDRFKNSSTSGGLDVSRVEEVLAQSPAASPAPNEPMTMANRGQLLQLALALADRTL